MTAATSGGSCQDPNAEDVRMNIAHRCWREPGHQADHRCGCGATPTTTAPTMAERYEPPAIERRTPVDPEVCGYVWAPVVDHDDLRRGLCHRCGLAPGRHSPHCCRCGATNDQHWE